jgi:hypothetical protein
MCIFYLTKKSTSTIKWPQDKTFRSLVAASSLLSPSSLILSVSIEKWQQREDKENKNNADDIISTRVPSLFYSRFFLSLSLSFFLFFCLLLNKTSFIQSSFPYCFCKSTIHLHSIRILFIKHIFLLNRKQKTSIQIFYSSY